MEQYINNPESDSIADISEGQALKEVAQAVDVSDVVHRGEGSGVVYAYGYGCAPDRLKIGMTEGDTLQRIVAQITTGTPDKPILLLEIRTHNCRALERAIHATLEHRGRRIMGGGAEWFKANREEAISIYEFITKVGS